MSEVAAYRAATARPLAVVSKCTDFAQSRQYQSGVDTTAILAFRHPSQAELLLESLVRLPSHARKVTNRCDLPSALQRIAIQAMKAKKLWGAWARDSAIWFVTAETSMALSRQHQRPSLIVSSFDHRGKVCERTLWVNFRNRGWRRCVL